MGRSAALLTAVRGTLMPEPTEIQPQAPAPSATGRDPAKPGDGPDSAAAEGPPHPGANRAETGAPPDGTLPPVDEDDTKLAADEAATDVERPTLSATVATLLGYV